MKQQIELAGMLPILGSNLFLAPDDPNVKKALDRYGQTHSIEAVKGTSPLLSKLKENQSVIWGDGETYHFRLTKL